MFRSSPLRRPYRPNLALSLGWFALCALALTVAVPATAGPGVSPAGKRFGLGVQIGAPTAITVKGMVDDHIAIVGGLGGGAPWLLGPTLSGHVDMHYYPLELVDNEDLTIAPYLGGGGQVGVAPFELVPNRFYKDPHPVFGYTYAPFPSFGVSTAFRAPVGLNLALHQVPIELYGELVPTLLFFPAIGGGLGGTLGGRVFF